MSDLIREELAFGGWNEGNNFVLVSMDDLTKMIQVSKEDRAVIIGNPRTEEFTVGRTTLIPGMLKWVSHNKKEKVILRIKFLYLKFVIKLPINIFEVGDVVLKDDESEVGAIN